VAMPIWDDRISPVFDVAKRLLVADVENGCVLNKHEAAIKASQLAPRAKCVTDLEVQVLICGAISWPLERMLLAAGVRVIPQVCGLAEQVMAAFVAGQLEEQAFLMPGCCGRRRQQRGGRHRGQAGPRQQGDMK